VHHRGLELTRPPDTPFDAWMRADDMLDFLIATSRDEIVLHCLQGGDEPTNIDASALFLSSTLYPEPRLTRRARRELVDWNFDPLSGLWGYGTTFEDGEHTRLLRPFEWEEPPALQHCIPLIIRRENSLEMDRTPYYELDQAVQHVHDLHWVEPRRAYCRLDEYGDYRDVVRIGMDGYRGEITIEEDILARHLALGELALIRFFEIDRGFRLASPTGPDHDAARLIRRGNITARWTPVASDEDGVPGRAYLRGVQILRLRRDGKLRTQLASDRAGRRYTTFLAQDWKHSRLAEVSCDPDRLGNYFVPSDLPFETTPAFFRRDVLHRYQADPEKYRVSERQIICRNAWALRFGENEAGQVHAYLVDLGRLPYQEQLYWKSFNEPPQGGIGRHAFKTDFLGSWDIDPEPLRDLKALLRSFPAASAGGQSASVWDPPSGAEEDLAERLQYLATNSPQEWESEIIKLAKVTVEGLSAPQLRIVGRETGLSPEELERGTIKLVRRILEMKGLAADVVDSVATPLEELWRFRSKLGAHRKGKEAAEMIREVRRNHRDLSAHYRALMARVGRSFRSLADLVSRGDLNVS
jgi:hypothetical protein